LLLANVTHTDYTSLLSVALGVGLAAATGFRVFLPLLVAGLAARAGWIPLTDSFWWLSGTPALLMLGTAAVVETFAYYIPGVDHLLDVIAGPASVVAGVIVSASVMSDVPAGVMWPVAIIAGGGLACLTKGTSAVIRAKSSLMTGGLANPVVSTAETASATVISILAVVMPLICVVAVLALLVWTIRKAGRIAFGGHRAKQDDHTTR
jgi:Domain of unknown function (DUF4126)